MAGEGQVVDLAADDRYQALVRRRSRYGWLLTTIVLVVFFGYILLIAFRRDILAMPIGGGVTSLGIPLGIGVILAGIVLTGLYVHKANRDFDPAMAALRREYGQ